MSRQAFIASISLVSVLIASAAIADDQPQWGQHHSRNQVSGEKNLPDRFDPESGTNIKWSVPLGTSTYSTPVIANGHVLIGTNNDQPRDPRHDGDRGVMMCLDEASGKLVWQLVVPKLSADIFFDWPHCGMCSTATVEGDHVYTVTNRDEVVCLDLHGLANGNDGPYQDEGRHMSPADQPAMEVGPLDADIIWLLDLREAAGVRPHDSSHCSVLIDGSKLYVNTSNGLTSKHDGVDKPEAPSLVVVDKTTGRLLGREREEMSKNIFHCTWSSPALGTVGGKHRIFFCGGDGICYGFEPHDTTGDSLRCVWRFDCDPTAPKENIHQYIRNRKVSPSNIKSMPVFDSGNLYVTGGGDIWWGKLEAWLQCIDATGAGDVTETALRWSYPVERHCVSTPAVDDGLVYVADSGKVHCVDAKTGKACWVHDAEHEIWASPLVADGRVYIGTRRGTLCVLQAGREKRLISSIRLDDGIYASCVAANDTLYVTTMSRIFALAVDKNLAP